MLSLRRHLLCLMPFVFFSLFFYFLNLIFIIIFVRKIMIVFMWCCFSFIKLKKKFKYLKRLDVRVKWVRVRMSFV